MTQHSRDRRSLKKRIHNGETVVGIFIPMWTDQDRLATVLKQDNYDFVWTDGQHAPLEENRLYTFCSMVAESGLDVLFRIKHTREVYKTGNYMDLGPSGTEIPQVEDEATVEEAIKSFYYSPVGERSYGGQYRVGAADRGDRREYMEWWNDYGVMWVQVESVEATTISRRLAKPGVDCLSFGPADLDTSLELHPNHPFQSIDDCVRYVVGQLDGTGVAVCFRSYDPKLRRKYFDMGVTVLLERPAV